MINDLIMMTWNHRNLVLLFYRWYFSEIKIIITIIINTYDTSELKKPSKKYHRA